MAGFYDRRRDQAGEAADRFVILTTRANRWMEDAHDRMLVVLRPEECEAWLGRRRTSPDCSTGGMCLWKGRLPSGIMRGPEETAGRNASCRRKRAIISI